MDNGQNKASARGPLIAVIKIEIDSTRTDRIFLHQHDNDHQLAQQFVQKHALNVVLTPHIYQRIRYSREALQNEPGGQEQPRSSKRMDYSNSNYKLQTPVHNLVSQRETQREKLSDLDQPERQVCEERLKERNKGHQQRYSYLQQPVCRNQRLFTASKHKEEHHWAQAYLQAPSKQQVIKEKEFMFYDNFEQEENQSDVPLFGQQQTPVTEARNSKNKENKCNYFSKQAQKSKFREERLNSESKAAKILQFLETKDKQQTLRATKSVAKFKPSPLIQEQAENLNKTEFSRVSQASDYTKPTHVKIMRKEEIQSLNQSLKKSMSKQQISKINQEVTKRLYNQVSIKKNYLNIIREKAKKEKQIIEDAELTHRPIINQISHIIAQGRKKDGVSVELHLIDKGKKVEAKRHEQLGRKALEELNGCTFKPELNVITQKLAQDREELESRMKIRESNRKSRYQDQNKFKPQLNNITRQLMKDRGRFEERQRNYLEQKNERLVNLVREKLLKQTKDELTGQQLFKPKINESAVRESQGANIGNYLHILSKQPKEVNQPISMVPRISEASELMVREMQTRRLTWLFGELDGDQDGLISAQKINIETISPQVLAIIKPILFEMEEINEELRLEEFINAVKVLHKRLTAFEKDKLYNVKKQVKMKQIVD